MIRRSSSRSWGRRRPNGGFGGEEGAAAAEDEVIEGEDTIAGEAIAGDLLLLLESLDERAKQVPTCLLCQVCLSPFMMLLRVYLTPSRFLIYGQ